MTEEDGSFEEGVGELPSAHSLVPPQKTPSKLRLRIAQWVRDLNDLAGTSDDVRPADTVIDTKPMNGASPPAPDAHERLKVPIWVLLVGLVTILATGSVKPLLPEFPARSMGKWWIDSATTFTSELGMALIISYVIALGIDVRAKRLEQRARAREQQEHLRREQRLIEDVFTGVLGIQHSSAYVKKVIETTLNRNIVRRTVTLIYYLKRIKGQEAIDLEIQPGHFMMLDQVMTFEFQNLSMEPQPVGGVDKLAHPQPD